MTTHKEEQTPNEIEESEKTITETGASTVMEESLEVE